jgi:hypothetical protein
MDVSVDNPLAIASWMYVFADCFYPETCVNKSDKVDYVQ